MRPAYNLAHWSWPSLARLFYTFCFFLLAGVVYSQGASVKDGEESADQKSAQQEEMERLEGAWTPVAVESGGVRVEGKDVKEADRQAFRFILKDGKSPVSYQGKTVQADVQIDPNQKPKTLNRVFPEGEPKGTVQRSIYKLDGDALKLCFNAEKEQVRPKEFTSRGTFVIVTYKGEKETHHEPDWSDRCCLYQNLGRCLTCGAVV